jgi:hypothetical protein
METRPKMDPGCVSQLQGVLPEEYALHGKITGRQSAVSRRESVHSGSIIHQKQKAPLPEPGLVGRVQVVGLWRQFIPRMS